MNRDLLKEAIADAKAVKETAIANAKAALEEAFTPYLKEKLAAKLAEMDDMEEAEIEEAKKDEKEMKENFDMDETKEMDVAYNVDEADEMEEGKELDEMDLDELLRELDEMEEGKKEDVMEGEDDLINEPKGPTAHGNVAEEEEVEMGEEEDEEIDLENMSEDDLKSFIETVIADMVAAGELEGNIEGGEEEGEEVEIEDEEETDLMERKKYGGNKGDVPAAKRGDKKDTAEEEGVEDYKKKKVAEIYDIGAMSLSDAEAILAAIAGVVGVPLASIAAAYAEDKIRGVKDLIKGKKPAMKEGDDMYEGEVDEMKKEVEYIKFKSNECKSIKNSKILQSEKMLEGNFNLNKNNHKLLNISKSNNHIFKNPESKFIHIIHIIHIIRIILLIHYKLILFRIVSNHI